MLNKTITYTDYNGEERTETFNFNLSKAEVAEMELGVDGGLTAFLGKMVSTKNVPEIAKFFKTFILKSYGEKSADGRRMIKSEKMAEEFTQTEAYSELFMELIQDPDKMAAFFNGVVPRDFYQTEPDATSAAPDLSVVDVQ